MRIVLKLSSNSKIVPFDYQRVFAGTFHKWLGQNQEHDEMSLYSLSWLQGGRKNDKGLDFRSGADWVISAHDISLIKRVLLGVKRSPEISFGMRVKEVSIVEDPRFEGKQKFYLHSPIFIKRKQGNRTHFFLYDNLESDALMTQTLQTKLEKAGLDASGVSVSFDRSYHSPKTKKIDYNGIGCRASICPVIVEGSPEQIAFAWNVGIGNSTGIGFGALK